MFLNKKINFVNFSDSEKYNNNNDNKIVLHICTNHLRYGRYIKKINGPDLQ